MVSRSEQILFKWSCLWNGGPRININNKNQPSTRSFIKWSCLSKNHPRTQTRDFIPKFMRFKNDTHDSQGNSLTKITPWRWTGTSDLCMLLSFSQHFNLPFFGSWSSLGLGVILWCQRTRFRESFVPKTLQFILKMTSHPQTLKLCGVFPYI